ncbi:hypothetical protein HYU07_06910 [Candidatus Woesearchaeota archaeon]|nr:hypothetical protein [Candidatus Woesearchaeota archaeon]
MDEDNRNFKIYLAVLEEDLGLCLSQSTAKEPIETIVSNHDIPNSTGNLKEKIRGVIATEQRGTKERPDDKYKLLDTDYPVVDSLNIHFSHSVEKAKLLNKFLEYKTKTDECKKQEGNSRIDGVLLITDSRTIGSIDKLIQTKYSIIRTILI